MTVALSRETKLENLNQQLLLELAECKQVIEALAASEARFRSVAQSTSDAIIAADETGHIVLWNLGAQTMFGYTEAEVMGQPLTLLMPPRYWAAHQAGLARYLSTGQPKVIGKTVELYGLRKNGQEFPLELSLSVWTSEVETFFNAIIRDTSERKQAEAVRDSEKYFRALIENSSDAIALFSAEGTILYGSSATARILGYSLEEFVGRNAFDLIHPDDHEFVLNCLTTVRQEAGARINMRARTLHKNGSWRFLEGVFTNLLADPAVGAIVTNYRDITERQRAEAAQRFMAEASLLLAKSLDYETTLASVAHLAVPHIADWCAVDVLAEDGTLQRLAVAHVDPAKVAWAHELRHRLPYDPDAPSGLAHVLRTGQSEFYPEIPDELLVTAARGDAETLQILRKLGFTSSVIVPLLARGHTFGAIILVSAESGRHYDSKDLALAEDLARRAAVAIDTARLYRLAQEEIAERKQAEAALAEEHALVRTFIDNIPDAVYVKDTESRFLIANKMVAQFMAATSADLIGQTDFDFYEEELARKYFADEQAIIASGQSLINKEEFHLDPGGNQRWLSTTKVPFWDSQGKIKGIIGISRDITERKQMDQALQKAHDQLEARVEQRTAELKSANEQLAAVYKLGQLITAPLRLDVVLDLIVRSTAQLLQTDTGVILLLDEAGETLTIKGAYGISDQAVKETRDRVGESIAGRVVQTGQPIIANDLPNDPRFHNPASAQEGLLACVSVPLVVGEKIIGTLDVHSKVHRYAFTEAHLQILKMLASQAAIAIENARLYEEIQRARDELEERVQQRTAELVVANTQLQQEIRERQQSEQALRLSEERFAKAFRASPAAVTITRLVDGCFVDVNDSFLKIFGYSREELIGHRSMELNMFTNPDERAELVRLLREQGWVREYEMAARTKSGEICHILFSTEELALEGEAHILAIIFDISERKQAEERLKQVLAELARSNAELQQFAYVASHDLQEPLRMVASYTQLLARRYQGKLDADADDFITYAVDGANRMQRLINDLLAYSRVGTRGQALQPTDSELILEQVLANLRAAIAESKAVVTHTALPTVLADETQLVQLFQNLIGNALKFCNSQLPQVHISAEREENEWLFSVSDNGIGLEPQYAERIFVIFQRLHNKAEYPGTGIGLAICKRIVERHGGRMWVESQLGQGATFYFTLPVMEAMDDRQVPRLNS